MLTRWGGSSRPSRSRLAEEAAHHFLWRIRKALPRPGVIGVFDRSHYEDVLVPRVHELVPEAEWRRRYEEINAFEAALVEHGTTVVKCLLHISYATQRERLLARLDDPTKRWKFNEGDIDRARLLGRLSGRIRRMLQHCSPEHAPWYVVPERPEVVPELGRRAIARSRRFMISIRVIRSHIWTLSVCGSACNRRTERLASDVGPAHSR